MTTTTIAVVGVALLGVVYLFAWSICRAAAQADEASERAFREAIMRRYDDNDGGYDEAR